MINRQTVPQQTVKSVNKFYESTLLQQTVQSTVLRYLIPDLSTLVLKYCWPLTTVENEIDTDIIYGNYEKIKTIIADKHTRGWNWSYLIGYACREGYVKIIQILETDSAEHLDWTFGICGAIYGDNIEIIKLIIKEKPHEDKFNISWSTVLSCAYEQKNTKAIKFFTDSIDNLDPDDVVGWEKKFLSSFLQT